MQLRCATFAATDSATIIDRHDFDGDILELIEEAQKYIIKNIHIGVSKPLNSIAILYVVAIHSKLRCGANDKLTINPKVEERRNGAPG